MTATDELRRMLDEAGEYYKTSGNRTWWGRPIDMQTGKPINVFHYQAQPMGEDRLFVELQLATPEQAIAATLGPSADELNATLGDTDATRERQDGAGIVRCKDCKHYSEHEWALATDVSDVCHFWHGEPTKVEPDGFCAWGERKMVAE